VQCASRPPPHSGGTGSWAGSTSLGQGAVADEPEENALFHSIEDTSEWERGLADALPLTTSEEWQSLEQRYEADRHEDTHNLRPWRRCLQVARSAGAVCAIVERRYICYDFRSEYAAFYTHVLAGVPSTAHRIHFFGSPVTLEDFRHLTDVQERSYKGYIVCRPRDLEIVGRTMLAPPEEVCVLTGVTDSVTFFGQPLTVTAVPFMQQDERLGVCANVSAWIVHYSAYRRRQVHRRLMAEFLNQGDNFFSPRAAIGVQPLELVALLDGVGFRTEYFETDSGEIPKTEYPWDHEAAQVASEYYSRYEELGRLPASLTSTETDPVEIGGAISRTRSEIVEECCRSLNSGIPAIVCSVNHTSVICGYELLDNERQASFVVQDDQAGPYVEVFDCMFDRADLRRAQSPSVETPAVPAEQLLESLASGEDLEEDGYDWFEWLELLIPLPERVFLRSQKAERRALAILEATLDDASPPLYEGESPPELAELLAARKKNTLRFRTYLTSANRLKEKLNDRCEGDEDLMREFRSLRLSETVVVVEFVDTDGDLLDHRCLGEAVFDATSNSKNPWVHSFRVGTSLALVQSDGRRRLCAVGISKLLPGASPYSRLRLLQDASNGAADKDDT
jgi:hypothetical protein